MSNEFDIHTKLDKIISLLSMQEAPAPQAPLVDMNNYKHNDTVSQAVVQLILCMGNDNKKIDAIKLYRALTGQGLKEAKDAIEFITNRFRDC